mmetsp:Transcript_7601/g.27979  ORF Transcript_7601/g.27979 Transcript_7601/m.27979 type:complete len:428 (+) Transcript_7601:2066-3349(+)
MRNVCSELRRFMKARRIVSERFSFSAAASCARSASELDSSRSMLPCVASPLAIRCFWRSSRRRRALLEAVLLESERSKAPPTTSMIAPTAPACLLFVLVPAPPAAWCAAVSSCSVVRARLGSHDCSISAVLSSAPLPLSLRSISSSSSWGRLLLAPGSMGAAAAAGAGGCCCCDRSMSCACSSCFSVDCSAASMRVEEPITRSSGAPCFAASPLAARSSAAGGGGGSPEMLLSASLLLRMLLLLAVTPGAVACGCCSIVLKHCSSRSAVLLRDCSSFLRFWSELRSAPSLLDSSRARCFSPAVAPSPPSICSRSVVCPPLSAMFHSRRRKSSLSVRPMTSTPGRMSVDVLRVTTIAARPESRADVLAPEARRAGRDEAGDFARPSSTHPASCCAQRPSLFAARVASAAAAASAVAPAHARAGGHPRA